MLSSKTDKEKIPKYWKGKWKGEGVLERGIVEGIGTVVEMVEMVERGGERRWVDEEVKGAVEAF